LPMRELNHTSTMARGSNWPLTNRSKIDWNLIVLPYLSVWMRHPVVEPSPAGVQARSFRLMDVMFIALRVNSSFGSLTALWLASTHTSNVLYEASAGVMKPSPLSSRSFNAVNPSGALSPLAITVAVPNSSVPSSMKPLWFRSRARRPFPCPAIQPVGTGVPLPVMSNMTLVGPENLRPSPVVSNASGLCCSSHM